MESYYEINVSLNGMHFFATAPRSAVTLYDAKHLTEELRKRFPEAEGYIVECTRWECFGNSTYIQRVLEGLTRVRPSMD